MSSEWHEWMALLDTLTRATPPDDLRCPHCGAHTVEHRFHAGSDRRGYGAIWCTTCVHGVALSRMEYSPEVETRPIDSAGAIPQFEVVKPQ